MENLKKMEDALSKAKMRDCFNMINLGEIPLDGSEDSKFDININGQEVMNCKFSSENFIKTMVQEVPKKELNCFFEDSESESLFKVAYVKKYIEEVFNDSFQELLREADILYQHFYLFEKTAKINPQVVRKELIKPIEKKILKRLNVKGRGGSNKKFGIGNPFHLEQLAEHYLFLKSKFENLKKDVTKYSSDLKFLEALKNDPDKKQDYILSKFMLEQTEETVSGYIACDALIKMYKYKDVTPDTLYRELEDTVKSIPWLNNK